MYYYNEKTEAEKERERQEIKKRKLKNAFTGIILGAPLFYIGVRSLYESTRLIKEAIKL